MKYYMYTETIGVSQKQQFLEPFISTPHYNIKSIEVVKFPIRLRVDLNRSIKAYYMWKYRTETCRICQHKGRTVRKGSKIQLQQIFSVYNMYNVLEIKQHVYNMYNDRNCEVSNRLRVDLCE